MRTQLILAALAALSLSACNVPPAAEHTEFVCYDDGALVERHVGVWYVRQSGAMWRIVYTDSDEIKFYQQPAGETCGLETY